MPQETPTRVKHATTPPPPPQYTNHQVSALQHVQTTPDYTLHTPACNNGINSETQGKENPAVTPQTTVSTSAKGAHRHGHHHRDSRPHSRPHWWRACYRSRTGSGLHRLHPRQRYRVRTHGRNLQHQGNARFRPRDH